MCPARLYQYLMAPSWMTLSILLSIHFKGRWTVAFKEEIKKASRGLFFCVRVTLLSSSAQLKFEQIAATDLNRIRLTSPTNVPHSLICSLTLENDSLYYYTGNLIAFSSIKTGKMQIPCFLPRLQSSAHSPSCMFSS